MSRNELIAKIEALNEWERLIAEAQAEAFRKGDKLLGAWRTISGECFLVMPEDGWKKAYSKAARADKDVDTTFFQRDHWESELQKILAEAEAIKDSIKAEMLEQQTEELEAGAYIIRWTSVLTNRFDSTAFKREYGELYKRFTKQISSRRFSIV